MKIVRFILLMVLMPVACGHLPEIRTVDDSTAAGRTAGCADIFPRGQWQLVHAIEIFPPAGSKQTAGGHRSDLFRAKNFSLRADDHRRAGAFRGRFRRRHYDPAGHTAPGQTGYGRGHGPGHFAPLLCTRTALRCRGTFRESRRGSAATRPPIRVTRTSSCNPTALGKSAVTARATA